MNQLFQTKSTVAKLLAAENIIVEHRKVPSAYFDLENRVMVLPYFKEMTGELYDLLTGHETGHALYTPKEGWHDAVVNDRKFKSYLNVIEDARIERKIKDKFPGLRRSFNIAYKRLVDDDFFGINGRDVNKMLFIDRINIFYKLGAHVRVSFNEQELSILDEINRADSWEEIVEIARKVYNKAKEDAKNAPQPEMLQDELVSDDLNDSESYDDDSEEYTDSDDFSGNRWGDDDNDDDENNDDLENDDEEDSEEEDSKEEDSKEEDSKEEDVDDESRSNGHGKGGEPDVSSETDWAFRQNEKLLINDSSGEVHIINVPLYNKNCIVTHKQVHAKINKHFELFSSKEHYASCLNEFRTERYVKILNKINPVVNYMVKEFEMRKNASQLSRARIAKSGKINPKKLARFSLDQDIFQRVTSVPQGKNHGLVLVMDLSGSMSNILNDVFEQVIVLTRFCKKVNLPFEVYGFNDLHHEYFDWKNIPHCILENNDLKIVDRSFHMKQYLSSNMTSSEYRNACSNMIFLGASEERDSFGYSYKNSIYRDLVPPSESLGGTPLDEAVIASMDIVKNFKEGYRLDNVNCIFLTDGDSRLNTSIYSETDGWKRIKEKDTAYLQHKITKDRVLLKKESKGDYRDGFTTTRGLIEIAKKYTGAKYTGYFIGNSRCIVQKLLNYEYTGDQYSWAAQREKRNSLAKRIKHENFISSNKFGFDEYFLVLNSNLKIEENGMDYIAPDAKKSVLSRAFIKSMSGRNLQRMFLNRFMQNIAA